MKMTYPHYDELRRNIASALKAKSLSITDCEAQYKELGLTDRRFAFDLLWAIPQGPRQQWFDDNEIYDYLNDDHIYTALKSAIKDIKQGKVLLAELID